MRKLMILTLFYFITFSCTLSKKESNCEEFKSNLMYLKKSIIDKDGTYNVSEIEKKITFLETKSGIKSKDQGNILGKFIVTQDDIVLWQEWLDTNCNNDKNFQKE